MLLLTEYRFLIVSCLSQSCKGRSNNRRAWTDDFSQTDFLLLYCTSSVQHQSSQESLRYSSSVQLKDSSLMITEKAQGIEQCSTSSSQESLPTLFQQCSTSSSLESLYLRYSSSVQHHHLKSHYALYTMSYSVTIYTSLSLIYGDYDYSMQLECVCYGQPLRLSSLTCYCHDARSYPLRILSILKMSQAPRTTGISRIWTVNDIALYYSYPRYYMYTLQNTTQHLVPPPRSLFFRATHHTQYSVYSNSVHVS